MSKEKVHRLSTTSPIGQPVTCIALYYHYTLKYQGIVDCQNRCAYLVPHSLSSYRCSKRRIGARFNVEISTHSVVCIQNRRNTFIADVGGL